MDIYIVLTGFLAFLFLIFLLPFVFRMIHAFSAIPWYLWSMGVVAGGCFILWNCVYSILLRSTGNYIEGAIASLCIYVLLAIWYLFGVFGDLEASITLHILTMIARSGKGGIPLNAITASYNRQVIVKRRIERLMWSREIIIVGMYYRLSKKISHSVLREYFFRVLNWIFPRQ